MRPNTNWTWQEFWYMVRRSKQFQPLSQTLLYRDDIAFEDRGVRLLTEEEIYHVRRNILTNVRNPH